MVWAQRRRPRGGKPRASANAAPANVKISDLSLMEQVRIRLGRQQSDRRESINTSFRSISSHESGKHRRESFNTSCTSIMDDGSKSYSRRSSSRDRRESINESLSSILDDGKSSSKRSPRRGRRESVKLSSIVDDGNKQYWGGRSGSSSNLLDRSLVIFDGNIVESDLERKFESKSAPSAVAPPITDDAEYIITKKVVCIVDEAKRISVSQSLESSLSKLQRSLSMSPNKPRSKRKSKRRSKSIEAPMKFIQVPL